MFPNSKTSGQGSPGLSGSREGGVRKQNTIVAVKHGQSVVKSKDHGGRFMLTSCKEDDYV